MSPDTSIGIIQREITCARRDLDQLLTLIMRLDATDDRRSLMATRARMVQSLDIAFEHVAALYVPEEP